MLLPQPFCSLLSDSFEINIEVLAAVISLVKTNVSFSIEDVLGGKKSTDTWVLLGLGGS